MAEEKAMMLDAAAGMSFGLRGRSVHAWYFNFLGF
jgi:hypothetical protein